MSHSCDKGLVWSKSRSAGSPQADVQRATPAQGSQSIPAGRATRSLYHGQRFNPNTVVDHRGWRCPVPGIRAAYGLPHRLAAVSTIMAAAGASIRLGTCARLGVYCSDAPFGVRASQTKGEAMAKNRDVARYGCGRATICQSEISTIMYSLLILMPLAEARHQPRATRSRFKCRKGSS